MSFESNLGGVREWGRKLVLPADKIQELLKEKIFDSHCVDKVIDFGAGTLYWSNWFREIVGAENIYPVDIIFKELGQDRTGQDRTGQDRMLPPLLFGNTGSAV